MNGYGCGHGCGGHGCGSGYEGWGNGGGPPPHFNSTAASFERGKLWSLGLVVVAAVVLTLAQMSMPTASDYAADPARAGSTAHAMTIWTVITGLAILAGLIGAVAFGVAESNSRMS